MDLLVM